MGQYSAIPTRGELNSAVGGFLRQLMEQGVIQGALVPTRQRHQSTVMQSLITDPAGLDQVAPFAPVVPTNSAKLVAQISAQPVGAPLAAVVRRCEASAFLELVKLNQGSADNVLLIGIDCLGRYENNDFRRLAAADENLTATFLGQALGGGETVIDGADIADACKACAQPVPDNVDLNLCVLGANPGDKLWVEAVSDKGGKALADAGLELQDAGPDGRKAAVDKLVAQRGEFREAHLAPLREQTADMAGLAELLAPCINCYNCRVACPVCYCRECVFLTDTFRHGSEQYLRWSQNRGQIRMPTDTVFYHLVRMIHMSTLCVGCGQCSSACPNDIPVMELFQTVADKTQARFDYVPGRSLDEGQPLAVFYSEEFDDVTGQVK